MVNLVQIKEQEGILMNDSSKLILTILVILYIVSPVDFCPGPIDDIIVLLLGLAARKNGTGKKIEG